MAKDSLSFLERAKLFREAVIKAEKKMAEEIKAYEWVKQNTRTVKSEMFGTVRREPTPVQAYLAGLKAGRPQWHDLRKDPNDLPKHSVRVLVLLEDKLYEISSISADNRWVCTDYYTGEDKVIAWCEIPTFDKE